MRRKLSRIEDDKNYYYSAEIKLDKNRVYTILGKTNQSNLDEIKELIKSFKIVGECKKLNIPDNYFKKCELNVDEIRKLYIINFLVTRLVFLGVFLINLIF
jgi:hypothetical protein